MRQSELRFINQAMAVKNKKINKIKLHVRALIKFKTSRAVMKRKKSILLKKRSRRLLRQSQMWTKAGLKITLI